MTLGFWLITASAGMAQTLGESSVSDKATALPETSLPPPSAETIVKNFKDIEARMHQAMNAPLTGNVDKDFASTMIPHHQAAVEMATTLIQYGKDPELRAMAEEILSAQKREMAILKAWLEKNGQ